MTRTRAGFSLLEVILALAILAASVVILGELIRIGANSADQAVALSQAQLLCEGKLAELTSADQLPGSTGLTPFESVMVGAEGWKYSVSVEGLTEESLYSVSVTVVREDGSARPTEFTLVRWMVDPAATTAASTSTGDSSGDTSTSASGTSAGGASSAGGAAGGGTP